MHTEFMKLSGMQYLYTFSCYLHPSPAQYSRMVKILQELVQIVPFIDFQRVLSADNTTTTTNENDEGTVDQIERYYASSIDTLLYDDVATLTHCYLNPFILLYDTDIYRRNFRFKSIQFCVLKWSCLSNALEYLSKVRIVIISNTISHSVSKPYLYPSFSRYQPLLNVRLVALL